MSRPSVPFERMQRAAGVVEAAHGELTTFSITTPWLGIAVAV